MNMNTLIVVADAARARLFQVATTDSPRAPIALREVDTLVHPESRIKEVDRYSGSFPAGVRTGKVGQGHTMDDHREAHDTEERRRFAKAVAQKVTQVTRESSNNPVIVVATHALHSLLMGELERDLPREILVRSDVGELSELPPHQLLTDLEARGLFRP